MGEKILYYFGAGASAQALPIAQDVEKDGKIILPGLPKGLENARPNFRAILNDLSIDQHIFLNNIFSDFESLAQMGREFGNIDTYAKYLFLKLEEHTLNNLKRTLAMYFCMMQMWRGEVTQYQAIDKRYLPWLVSVMDRTVYPENIKILSWNYDFQIQMACRHFSQENISYTEEAISKTFPLINYYPPLGPTPYMRDEFEVIHLNGIAGLFKDPNGGFKHPFIDEYLGNQSAFINTIMNNDMSAGIHFAWEGGEYYSSMIDKIYEMIADTTIVVVIGYSFPFFNREVDKAVFNKLKEKKTLRKIYYQDPVLNGQQLRAQFGLDETIEIEHVSRVDNFHIPFEY